MHFQKLTATLCVTILLLTVLLGGCNTPADTTDSTTTASTTTTTATTTAAPTTTTTVGPTATLPSGVTTPSWSATTTVAEATSSQKPSTKPLSEILGYAENADGTLTDKSNGVVFIDDEMNLLAGDGAKAQTVVGLVTTPTDLVEGVDVKAAAAEGATEAYLVYHLAGGIADVAVTTTVAEGTAIGTEFALYTSTDGKTWKVAPQLACSSQQTVSGVSTRTGYFYFNETDITYVKVQLALDKAGTQIARVRVGNVQNMHTPFEKAENRESATIYVDAKNGSDDNDGLTENTAFKTLQKAASRYFVPGDKLLLKRGGTYEGGVTLEGLGLAQRRITIGAYGKGADPVIAGGGSVTVMLKMDFVTVENLEFTNPNGLSTMKLLSNHTGAIKGIVIQNCNFHDVNNEVQQFTYSSGGIHFEISERTAPTWLEDLVIRNNTFDNLCRTAVYGTTNWAGREGVSGGGWGGGGTNNAIDDDNGWFPAKNMSITGNTMTDIQGDIVVIIGVRNLRISRNFAHNGFCINSQDLTRIIQTQGTNRCAAGLWSLNANDVYVEYNEVGYMRMPGQGGDGEAFDIDAAHKRAFIQYNYTHHNSGGFLLICGVDASNRISCDYVVRHNLSINETCISLSNVDIPTDIYNNTFIMGDLGTLISFYTSASNLFFRNNIFSGKNGGKVWIPSNYPLANIVFDNNLYTDGAELTDKVYSGRKQIDGPRWGVYILETNREVKGLFAENNLAFSEVEPVSNREAAIAAYTPIKNISGAYKTPSAVDINGNKITEPFYGCVIPKS